MNFPKFKLINSLNKEVIGYEYLTVDGWKNDVFDFGERDGSFDQRELGDGFLGVVQRLQYVGFNDKNGDEIFEGDIFDGDDTLSIRWSNKTGSFDFFFCAVEVIGGESLSESGDMYWIEAREWLPERIVSGNIFISPLS